MLPLRDDQARYSTPWVNYFLIVLNLLIFFFEASLDRKSLNILLGEFGVVPSHLTALLSGSASFPLLVVVVPFFTALFLHASWMHVIGNMWFLFIFGDNVEDYLGHFKYMVFYILTGLIAMGTHVFMNMHSRVPAVGASGAIAGVLGAYFVLYPRARVLTWFPPVFFFHVSAWIVLGYWFLLNFLSGTATELTARQSSMG